MDSALGQPEWHANQTLGNLKKSAQEGCLTCNWLWNGVPEYSRLQIRISSVAEDRVSGISFHRRWKVNQLESHGGCFELYDRSRMELVNWTKLGVHEGAERPSPQYHAVLAPSETGILSSSYTASINTGAGETLCLAKQWLEKCISSHSSCAAYRRPGWVPSRLLKLHLRDDDKIGARLEELAMDDYNSTAEYVALSHRWQENNECLLLSHKNISQLRNNIEVPKLKASIRDAMSVAVHLGVYHIWVDSLCIQQDNDKERAEEIAKMDLVYGSARCTIAAGVGETADVGCFISRDVNEVRTHGVNLRLGGHETRYYHIRPSWNDTNRELDNTSLAKRGWTLQERLLSPRTLHFCAKQVHWECREFEANETHTNGDPTHDSRTSVGRFTDLAKTWPEVVEAYTARLLSKQEDRLNAIAGIVASIQRNSTVKGQNDEYLHGLWRSSLPLSLLWYSKHEPENKRLIKVAPTWSWGSTRKEICYSRNVNGISLVEILGILKATDTFKGNIIRVTRMAGFDGGVLHIRGRFFQPSEGNTISDSSPFVRHDWNDVKRSISTKTDKYLPLFKNNSSNIQGGATFIGIVLRSLGPRYWQCYERVGHFSQYIRVEYMDMSFGEKKEIYIY
ncbi:hypothetical protein TruAng_002328 [Truncatella angustata]|nr:hypothetical protein TruAng_002328 [Truncatella angustata]